MSTLAVFVIAQGSSHTAEAPNSGVSIALVIGIVVAVLLVFAMLFVVVSRRVKRAVVVSGQHRDHAGRGRRHPSRSSVTADHVVQCPDTRKEVSSSGGVLHSHHCSATTATLSPNAEVISEIDDGRLGRGVTPFRWVAPVHTLFLPARLADRAGA